MKPEAADCEVLHSWDDPERAGREARQPAARIILNHRRRAERESLPALVVRRPPEVA